MSQKIRKYTIVSGPETPVLPAGATPTDPNDVVTKGYLDDNFANLTEWSASVDDIGDLKDVAEADRVDQQVRAVQDQRGLWQFESSSSATGDDYFVATPTAGSGRWLSLWNRFKDFTASFFLLLKVDSGLTADRTLTLDVNDADRTVDLSGDLTVSATATVSGSNTGDQTITLTGDVTGSGTGSFAATIAADSVSNTKLANMATQTIKGRTTAGSGDPEDLTAAQATAILDQFQGDSGSGGVKGLVPAPGAGDAALNKFLKADGTWTVVSGGGGGGGGGGGSDLASILSLDEADLLTYFPENTILDDFNDADKGTKTNMVQSDSALIFDGTSLTGDYERNRDTTNTLGSIAAYIVARIQSLAPKATTISANTIIFVGDQTNLFTVGSKVLISKLYTSDGDVIERFLINSSNQIPSNVTVNSVSYNSGTDETTLVLNNPSSLDLDFDLVAADYPEKLRVRPFNFNFQVKSASASSYEDIVFDSATALATTKLLGEAYYRNLTGLTGTVLKIDSAFSPSGQYGLIRVMENVAGADLYWWYYTTDFGKNWVKHATSKSSGIASNIEDDNNLFYKLNNLQIVVGDNGKYFSTYLFNSGAVDYVKAVYGDLSVGMPTLLDTPTTGPSGPGNSFGAGVVLFDTGNSSWAAHGVAASDDMEFIVVVCSQSNNANAFVKYSDGGATFYGNSGGPGVTLESINHPGKIYVTGTTGSARIHWIVRNNSSALLYRRYPEVSLTADTSTTIEASGFLIGQTFIEADQRITALVCNNARTATNVYDITSITGTPAVSAAKPFISASMTLTADNQRGANPGDIRAVYRTLAKSVVTNPSDSKHQFHIQTYFNDDNASRPLIAEIRDVTSTVGYHISQYTAAVNAPIRSTSATELRGQTFTANANAFRCFGMRVNANSKVPEGYTLTCKIYATAAGVPTGAALYTSVNTVDPARITTNANSQWIWFNFDGVSLTNGVVYAAVIEGDYPISASNYVNWKQNNVSSYAGGTDVTYNGTTWTSNASLDNCFEVRDHWMHGNGYELVSDVGNGNLASTQRYMGETGIEKIDSTTARFMMRPNVQASAAARNFNGFPYYGNISISGSSTVASVVTDPQIAGYNPSQVDENLIFATAYGQDSCSTIDVTTGVVSTVNKGEDRSGIGHNSLAYTNIVAGDYVADVDFESGTCIQLNGTNKSLSYENFALHNLSSTRPFRVELEVKFNAIGVTQMLVAKYNTAASHGWYFLIDSSNRLEFRLLNSAGTGIGRAISTNTFSAGVYYVFRATYDGLGTAPKIFFSTTGPNGTFTECTYGTSDAFSGVTASTSAFTVGIGNAGSFANAKIGYVKVWQWAPGVTPSPVYAGFLDQAPITALNIGSQKIIGVRRTGANTITLGVQYNSPTVIDATPSTAAFVDTRDIALSTQSQDIAGTAGNSMFFKITAERESTRDPSNIPGVIVKFNRDV